MPMCVKSACRKTRPTLRTIRQARHNPEAKHESRSRLAVTGPCTHVRLVTREIIESLSQFNVWHTRHTFHTICPSWRNVKRQTRPALTFGRPDQATSQEKRLHTDRPHSASRHESRSLVGYREGQARGRAHHATAHRSWPRHYHVKPLARVMTSSSSTAESCRKPPSQRNR
jgi:hypothetical protein